VLSDRICLMPRETSSVFDRLSLPGVDVPKKSDLVEEGSVSIKDTDKSKSELCSKWMRNKTNHYASRPKIPPVLGHQTVGRVEPLFGEPGKNPQRIRSCAFKSTTKYGYQDYRRNSSHGKRRQMAPRILFSGDVGLKTKGKRMSSRRPQSKDGWKNRRTNGDRECLEVGPTRGFPPEGSVLARYAASGRCCFRRVCIH